MENSLIYDKEQRQYVLLLPDDVMRLLGLTDQGGKNLVMVHTDRSQLEQLREAILKRYAESNKLLEMEKKRTPQRKGLMLFGLLLIALLVFTNRKIAGYLNMSLLMINIVIFALFAVGLLFFVRKYMSGRIPPEKPDRVTEDLRMVHLHRVIEEQFSQVL